MKQKGEMKVDQSLQELFEGRVEQFVSKRKRQSGNYEKAEQKLESFAKRSAEIVKVKAQGNIINPISNKTKRNIVPRGRSRSTNVQVF
jgi:hypothetical protein